MSKSKKIILEIDTSNREYVKVALIKYGRRSEVTKHTEAWSSQLLIPLIDELLKRNKMTAREISEIKVNRGPGSFTGLRVGISVTNTLGWLLNVPVNDQKGKIIDPLYKWISL